MYNIQMRSSESITGIGQITEMDLRLCSGVLFMLIMGLEWHREVDAF